MQLVHVLRMFHDMQLAEQSSVRMQIADFGMARLLAAESADVSSDTLGDSQDHERDLNHFAPFLNAIMSYVMSV